MFDLAAIEQAIKDAIAALKRPYIAEIKTYGGEFDVNDEREFSQVVRRFPAIWVTFSGVNEVKPRGASGSILYMTFTVLAGARSVRNEESARHGVVDQDGKRISVGSFELLRDIARALAGHDLGQCMTPLRPGKVSTLFNTRTLNEAVSVLAWDFHTSCELNYADFEDEDADWMRRISIDHVFKPGDELADASDQVELEP